jgi:hypothetical protein
MLLQYIAFYFLTGWKGEPSPDGGPVRLRCNPPFRVLVWLVLIFGPLLPVTFIMATIGNPKQALPFWGNFGFLVFTLAAMAGAVYSWREARLGFVAITGEGIDWFSPWWGTTSLAWSQIQKAERFAFRWHPAKPTSAIVLNGTDGSRLTFSATHWAGMDSLINAVQTHVKLEEPSPA